MNQNKYCWEIIVYTDYLKVILKAHEMHSNNSNLAEQKTKRECYNTMNQKCFLGGDAKAKSYLDCLKFTKKINQKSYIEGNHLYKNIVQNINSTLSKIKLLRYPRKCH